MCSEQNPCYQRTLVFTAEGNLDLNTDVSEQEFLAFYHKAAGLDRAGVLAHGRGAIDFYYRHHGLDLRYLSDEDLLSGNVDGPYNILFFPTIIGEDLGYRLTVASVGGTSFSTSQHYNSPILDAGWYILVRQEFQATGIYNGIVPANALLVYGHYIIRPCDSPNLSCSGADKCHDILGRDRFGAITILYHTANYFADITAPTTFGVIDCLLEHPVWGKGRARGVTFLREGGRSNRNVLTFPSYVEIADP